jgi:hypothetical protein
MRLRMSRPLPEDISRLLDKAVKSYRAADARARNFADYGRDPKKLIKKHPGFYTTDINNKITFIGKTADDILEDYLQELGHERGGPIWSALVREVVALAR